VNHIGVQIDVGKPNPRSKGTRGGGDRLYRPIRWSAGADGDGSQSPSRGRCFPHAPTTHSAKPRCRSRRGRWTDPEVTQRAAQQIRHHAGRPLEFRVRPCA
jgi:hypothetical protein